MFSNWDAGLLGSLWAPNANPMFIMHLLAGLLLAQEPGISLETQCVQFLGSSSAFCIGGTQAGFVE